MESRQPRESDGAQNARDALKDARVAHQDARVLDQDPRGAHQVPILPLESSFENFDFSNAHIWPLVTQAVVDGAGNVLYREALLRHASQGFNPGAFIRGLETSNRVEALDTATMARICEALQADPDVRLGLNASRKSLISAQWQEQLCRHAPVQIRQRLIVEVTESAQLTDAENQVLLAALQALAGQGFRFALDDLGKGAPTLQEIRDWPLTYVKLDRGLTATLIARLLGPQGSTEPAITIEALQAMEAASTWTLVAEGIEDRDHLDVLTRAGIAAFQGFAIERPQPSAY